MAALDPLVACAGRWAGTSRLQDPQSGVEDASASTATIAPILGNRFVRLDYTWAYHDAPQEGSLLVGHDAAAGEAVVCWVDTWHMGDKVMICRGSVEPGGAVAVRGSYAAPPGPDWGWRMVITPGPRRLRVVMFNIDPAGHEERAVEAEYEPAKSTRRSRSADRRR